MWETLEGVRRLIHGRARLAIVGFAVLGFAGPAGADSGCFTGGPSNGVDTASVIYDICATVTNTNTYETKIPFRSFVVHIPSTNKNYLVSALTNDYNVFEVSNPVAPTSLVAGAHIPWDWTSIDVSGSTHEPYINHLIDISTLDGFGYGIGSLGAYGWDVFQFNGTSTGFLGHGYKPASKIGGSGYSSSALFQSGNTIYAAAQTLDAASIANSDFSIRIYPFGGQGALGGAIQTSTLTPATIGSGILIPAGHAGDLAAFDNTKFPLVQGAQFQFLSDVHGVATLLVVNNGFPNVMLVVDVSAPNVPRPVGVVSFPTVSDNSWAVDNTRGMVWVGSSTKTEFTGYRIDTSNAASPVQVRYANVNYNWQSGSSTSTTHTVLTVTGDLLGASDGTIMSYFSLGGSSPTAIPPVTNPPANYSTLLPARSCANPAFFEGVAGLTAFQSSGGGYYVCRSLQVDADVIGISGGCMSTIPVPNFTATDVPTGPNGLPASCAGPGGFTQAAAAFPGDTINITDTSGGTWTSGTLDIESPLGTSIGASGGQTFPMTVTPRFGVPWAPPAAQAPGNYYVVLTIPGGNPGSITKVITLCANPTAKSEVTLVNITNCSEPNCSYVTNDTVTVGDFSQGTPTGWRWVLQIPNGTPQLESSQTSTDSIHLGATGTYQLWLIAMYGFAGATDGSCSAVTGFVPASGNYAACFEHDLVSNAFIVNPIVATQPGSIFPNFNTTSAISFSAAYKLASGYTATFAWSGGGIAMTSQSPVVAGGSSVNGATTGQIAAPIIGNGQIITLNASAAPTGGGAAIPFNPTSIINVSACVNPGQANNVSPANGATGVNGNSVTFMWNAPSTGTGPFTYDVVPSPNPFGLKYCSGVTTTSCTKGSLGAGSTITWQVITSNSCGTTSSSSVATQFTTAGSQPTPTPTPPVGPTPTPRPGGSLTITPPSGTLNAGVNLAFNFSPGVSVSGDSLNFNFGDGTSPTNVHYPTLGSNLVGHTFAGPGTFTVSGSGVAGGATVSGSVQVTIQSNCQQPAVPTAGFAWGQNLTNPQVKVGDTVYFVDQSTNSPTSWSWSFGDGAPPLIPGQTSSLQNPSIRYSKTGTFTVSMTAVNCKGASAAATHVITVLPQCSFSAVPVLSFVTTPVPIPGLSAFPEQQQPMVGQSVAFDPSASQNTDSSSATTWSWVFDAGSPGTSTAMKPVVTFADARSHLVLVNATNCVGGSQQLSQNVTVYPDVRHVTAEFSWDATAPSTGNAITFTAVADYAHGSPTDFVWDFGDKSPQQTGQTAIHVYSCNGTYTVTMTASGHGKSSSPEARSINVEGKICGPDSLVSVDAADVAGLNGTQWTTNISVFNPDTEPTNVTTCALPVGQNNVNPWCGGPVVLNPKATLYISNILAALKGVGAPQFTKAALKISYDNPNSVAPLIVSRTSTRATGGGSYGQYTPSIGVIPGSTPSTLWVTGLENNGTDTGFRTNYSLINLRGDAGGVGNIKATLIDPTGAELAQKTIGLAPYGYVQDSIAKLFGSQFANIGTFAVRIDVPDGADIQFFGSVVDNLTGAPVLISAGAPPVSPIYIAAIAHNPGDNGTVWRSDMQITNPDTAGHTWQFTFIPKGNASSLSTNVSFAPKETKRTEDAVLFLYNSLGLPAPDVSGMFRIAPAPGDNSGVYPIVASRSYNLTPAGTFGQNNIPLAAAAGISTTSKMQRLLITGMSSQDVQRTNFGFVNLSENNGVDFSVIFYDQSGNVLNPIDTGTGQPKPYTFALNVWGWDQDRLENRLKHLGVTLPSGLQTISAEVTIRGGGPGFVYATVIDNITGDPVFIPGQLAP